MSNRPKSFGFFWPTAQARSLEYCDGQGDDGIRVRRRAERAARLRPGPTGVLPFRLRWQTIARPRPVIRRQFQRRLPVLALLDLGDRGVAFLVFRDLLQIAQPAAVL